MGTENISRALACGFLLLLLTTAQAREAPSAAPARQPGGPRLTGYRDDSPKSQARQKQLSSRWRRDVQTARSTGRRVVEEPDPFVRTPSRAPRRLVPANGEFVYFPTADVTDGQFLALAGTVRTSTNPTDIRIKLAAPKLSSDGTPTTTFSIGIFDGDVSGKWDANPTPCRYTLYEDPLANGKGTTVALLAGGIPATWMSDGSSGANAGTPMPDDRWFSAQIPVSSGAQNPDGNGNYFYFLQCELLEPNSDTLNCFKVRTTASVRLEPQNSFNIVGGLFTIPDAQVIYPNYPSLSPSTYDGNWDFWVYVPSSTSFFEVWDGDFDYGDYNGNLRDTDDPDTDNATLPPWASPASTRYEGIASGWGASTGDPPDDYSGPLFRRSPCVNYDVTDPNGLSYSNNNPSGNVEWERFRIDTVSSDRSATDYSTGELPGGVYQFHINGLDLSNLVSLHFDYDLLGVDADGNPVKPILPYDLGDTVFRDLNGNGMQDAGEPGIAGVRLSLLDDRGFILGSATTDANGHYVFPVESGTYLVSVDVANFRSVGVLHDMYASTGTVFERTIIAANDLSCDFGFRPAASSFLGGVVWLDRNLDTDRDDSEPGLGGITVRLFKGGTEVARTMSDVNGFYLFTGVADGAYDIVVDGSTLPGGLTQTFDVDGLTTPNATHVQFIAGTPNVDNDFGYAGSGSVGRILFVDVNGNGTLDPADVGIGGVRIELSADFNGDGVPDLVTDTTTDPGGGYRFSALPAATYTVRVDTETLPFGLHLAFDPDGIATPNRATTNLAPGASDLTLNFGYQGLGRIGDTIWQDTNGNGVQDSDETGIAGVRVTLLADLNQDGSYEYQATTTTDANGKYLFEGLPAGQFTIRVDPTALPATTFWAETYDLDGIGTPNQATVHLAPQATKLNVDFGYQNTGAAAGGLSGTVWNDANADGSVAGTEARLAGVTVTLCDAGGAVIGTRTTDGSGFYSFSGLASGSYLVKIDPTTLPSGTTLPTYDPDGIATPGIARVVVTAPAVLTSLNFGYLTGASVGDFVWNDGNNNGIQDPGEGGLSGITVRLFTSENALIGSTTTDSSGAYHFTGLLPGSYYVRVTSPAGYAFSPQQQGSDRTKDSNPDSTGATPLFSLDAGQIENTVDAGLHLVPVAASISGRAYLDTNRNQQYDGSTDLPLSGVSITLTGPVSAVATSTADGSYFFPNLPAGTYTISAPAVANGLSLETRAGLVVVLAAGDNRPNNDFGYVPIPASVGDRVWFDANGNGLQDVGEPGIANVTVKLYSAAGALAGVTQTSGDGIYSFSQLDPGRYYVVVTAPPGYTFTRPYQGTNAGLDSNVDATGKSGTIVLGSGQNERTIDAGLSHPGVFPFTTYTQGGWGAPPSGNNAGALLQSNFSRVYSGGSVRVGGMYTLTFTSATAIRAFLPQGGTPAALVASATNPTGSYSVLAGQILSVRLSVDFSNSGVTRPGLANLRIQSGVFAGSTVADFLKVANAALGGATTGYNLTDINRTADAINNNFDSGTQNQGYLK